MIVDIRGHPDPEAFKGHALMHTVRFAALPHLTFMMSEADFCCENVVIRVVDAQHDTTFDFTVAFVGSDDYAPKVSVASMNSDEFMARAHQPTLMFPLVLIAVQMCVEVEMVGADDAELDRYAFAGASLTVA
jgi:hypothetical protein